MPQNKSGSSKKALAAAEETQEIVYQVCVALKRIQEAQNRYGKPIRGPRSPRHESRKHPDNNRYSWAAGVVGEKVRAIEKDT